jgi:imidazolonepropionase
MKTIWRNGRFLTMKGGTYSPLLNGTLVTEAGRIIWLGDNQACPDFSDANTVELNQAWVTPGLIDCHTHLVFGGERSKEFEMRLQGKSYAEIAAVGGGIVSTVNATQQADEETLYWQAKKRLNHLITDGVTTIEIKTGYGLDVENECKMLRVIQRLREESSITIKITALIAHALPIAFKNRQSDYVDYLCDEVLPAMAVMEIVDAVDAFCEHLAFTPAEVSRLFTLATQLGLPVKLHAEQLSHSGGTLVAAQFKALSADHLEHIQETDAVAMKKAGTVAVLLPGAYYLLREKLAPPVTLLRQHQVPIAVSTDCNPGTSPALSLRLMANMACTLFGLTVEEALAGITIYAAEALGCETERGSLEVGKVADFLIWEINEPAELVYWLGGTLPHQTVIEGSFYDC